MKLNRNKGSLQSELQKMLQAGIENVDNDAEQKIKDEETSIAELRTNTQTHKEETQIPAKTTNETAGMKKTNVLNTIPQKKQKQAKVTTKAIEAEPRTLNAAQRHEVPDRNAKYAGEPIKSVGCRMPQSLYARMLQYKALNDSQLNRITLNDIIIDAVEKFLDEN